MAIYHSKVIVIRSRNLGEADRVLTLFSEGHGKFEAVVKGARRQRSRFVGNTLPFNYLDAMFFTGKNLDSLSQAEILHSFSSLREDLTKLAFASYWVDLIDSFVPEKEELGEVFRFLLAAFIVLETATLPEVLNLAFQLRLLNYLGYQPQLDVCTDCSRELENQLGFSGIAGGVLCAGCGGRYRDLLPVDAALLQQLKTLSTIDIRSVASLRLGQTDARQLQGLVQKFIESRLDRPLKSQHFLDDVLS